MEVLATVAVMREEMAENGDATSNGDDTGSVGDPGDPGNNDDAQSTLPMQQQSQIPPIQADIADVPT